MLSFFGSGAFSVYMLYGGMENLIEKLQSKSELRYLDFGHVIKDNFEISSVLPHIYKISRTLLNSLKK